MRINSEAMPDEYDRRVFVGLPWAIAMVERTGIPYAVASQGICLIFSGLMCVIGAQWLRDARIGWALAILPPHFVLDTSAVMNESLMLLLCMVGLWACMTTSSRFRSSIGMLVLASLAFGAAGMVRPMACFATLGAIAMLLQDRKPRQAALLAAGSLVVFAVLFALFTKVYWNPIENVKVYRDHPTAYGGEMLTWPLKSFIHAAAERGVLRPAFLYKSLYIAAAIGLSIYGLVRWRRSRDPLDAMAATWLTANTLFVACIGSHWGVDIAQRSTAWALPAALYLLRDWLPTKWYWRLAWAVLPIPLIFVTSQT
jgi:hypothetical protein